MCTTMKQRQRNARQQQHEQSYKPRRQQRRRQSYTHASHSNGHVEWLLPYHIYIIILILSVVLGAVTDAQCIWEHNVDTSVATCMVRALDTSGLDLQAAQKANTLHIKCMNSGGIGDGGNSRDSNNYNNNNNNNNNNNSSNNNNSYIVNQSSSGTATTAAAAAATTSSFINGQQQYESEFPKNIFAHLQNLNELVIDSCKLHRLPRTAFAGLRTLKHLTIRTTDIVPHQHGGNGEFNKAGMARTKATTTSTMTTTTSTTSTTTSTATINGLHGFELNVDTFAELKELETLNMAENNLHAIPEGTFCELSTLQLLNISHNRIRWTENLGFSMKRPCSALSAGAGDKSSSSNSGVELDLRVLDISFNELSVLPENWTMVKFRRLQRLNLEHNRLTEVSGEALAGLPSLHIFNISYNQLTTLPSGLFYGARDFQEIHLQHNRLIELPRGIFHKLEQLLILDLSHNYLSNNNIDNSTFSGLIRLIVLNLAQNMLSKLDAKTFRDLYFLQILDLRNNSIAHIDDNTFLPLYNLHTLNLADNELHTIHNNLFNGLFVLSKLTLSNNRVHTIDASAFRNCTDLKELDLSTNRLAAIPLAVQNLTMLRTLDLGENQIKDIQPDAFRNMNQLTGLRLIDNQIGNISKYMFEDLLRLNVLNLAKNRIQMIERGSFDKNIDLEALRLDRNYLVDANGVFNTLNSLLWLNLGENHLVWFDYAFIPSNLKWLDLHGNYIEELGNYYNLEGGKQINVKTLDVSHNRIVDIGPVSVPKSIELLFINNNLLSTIQPHTFVDKMNLTRVDLYSNALRRLHLHTLRLLPVALHRPLPEFYLGGNPFECDCSMDWLLSINNMPGRQFPRLMDQANIECSMPSERHAATAAIRPLTSLTIHDFLCPYQTHCFALCQCCDYVACDCEMICPENCTCYHDQTWNANVVDCGNSGRQNELPKNFPMDTTTLYLDGNSLYDLKDNAFIGRKNLRNLYLNHSRVVNVHKRAFGNLHLLEILHLDHNMLRALHGHEFDNLLLLRQLYLHSNQIEYISNETFIGLQALQLLRIDNNLITSSMGMFLTTKSLLLPMHHNNMQYVLYMGQNPWSCACNSLRELVYYVKEHAPFIGDISNIYCIDIDNGNIRRDIDFNINITLTSDCSSFYEGRSVMLPDISINKHITLLMAILAFVALLACIILAIVFQTSLRIWLFAKCGVRICETIAGDCEKLYDALILYSEKDYELVTNDIANELEVHQPQLRLCLQHRDLTHNATYLQILESARASKRVVILLSRNFLQSEWSRYEVRNAVHEALKERPHKLVLLDSNDAQLEAENDLEMLPYIKSRVVSCIRISDKHFWEKLRYALPAEMQQQQHQRCNNYTLHHHYQHNISGNSSIGIGDGSGSGRGATACDPATSTMLLHQQQTIERLPKKTGRDGECAERQGLPLYYHDATEANYSSATTATPSPMGRRTVGLDGGSSCAGTIVTNSGTQNQFRHQTRPPSEHIYFSIDSDYNADPGDGALVPGTAPSNILCGGPFEGQHHQQQHQWRVHSNATIKSTSCAQQPYMV